DRSFETIALCSRSRKAKYSASAITPCFTASASPAASCTLDSESSKSRSMITTRGWWNAPSRFFPAGTSTAALPPLDESIIASTDQLPSDRLSVELPDVRVGDQRVGRGGAVLPEQPVHLADEPGRNQDVVGSVPLFHERHTDRHHVMSSCPVCMFTPRASTNS